MKQGISIQRVPTMAPSIKLSELPKLIDDIKNMEVGMDEHKVILAYDNHKMSN